MIDNLNGSQDACKNGRRNRSRGDFGQDSFFHEAGKKDRNDVLDGWEYLELLASADLAEHKES